MNEQMIPHLIVGRVCTDELETHSYVLFVCKLEFQLGAELHHSWAANGVSDLAEIGCALADDVVRRREVDVIENVENIPTELKVNAFCELGLFCEAHVETLLRQSA